MGERLPYGDVGPYSEIGMTADRSPTPTKDQNMPIEEERARPLNLDARARTMLQEECHYAGVRMPVDADMYKPAIRAIAAALAERPVVDQKITEMRRREVQMIGAAISNRSWHGVEVAYNQMRDKLDAWITIAARAGIEAQYGLNDTYPGDPVQVRASSLHQHALAAHQPATQPVDVEEEYHGLDTPDRVCFYEQDFYVLSNFSSFSLFWEGLRFDTSEHLYHWLKFATSPDGKSANPDIASLVLHAPSAHEAFKIAERHRDKRRPDWDDVKVDFMRRILFEKVGQHEYVRRKLLATGDRELVENSWRDDFWGWGPNRDGQNMLGKLWVEVRAELRALTEGKAL